MDGLWKRPAAGRPIDIPWDHASTQDRFDAAVFTITSRIIERNTRVDIAVADHLSAASTWTGDLYVSPDLIICVADCLRIIDGLASDTRSRASVLDAMVGAWTGMGPSQKRLDQKAATRIQSCVGTIRRAAALQG
ncbi:hypothetical protein CU669_01805 [Paramagnetospirillum kuznetsovii]|uniref:Uncharacterized protein n=1 Tax=Paramagnetospirillum kuznetsovii TaxID=2053833 RepID=A0A364P3E2_9PROT|nr:hypothetical protein [Paramagnetospirillum kuznetsovii]RAU23843.1 hypothetical protein CU669_01805 [Paramagnetospirillum kuznetsovii]